MKKRHSAKQKMGRLCCPSQELQELESSLRVIDEEVLPPRRVHLSDLEKCSSLLYHSAIRGPENDLLAAVLAMSYYDLAKVEAEASLHRDALRWFLGDFPYSGDYGEHLFSFDSICGYLNLDGKSIRTKIKEMYVDVDR